MNTTTLHFSRIRQAATLPEVQLHEKLVHSNRSGRQGNADLHGSWHQAPKKLQRQQLVNVLHHWHRRGERRSFCCISHPADLPRDRSQPSMRGMNIEQTSGDEVFSTVRVGNGDAEPPTVLRSRRPVTLSCCRVDKYAVQQC